MQVEVKNNINKYNKTSNFVNKVLSLLTLLTSFVDDFSLIYQRFRKKSTLSTKFSYILYRKKNKNMDN